MRLFVFAMLLASLPGAALAQMPGGEVAPGGPQLNYFKYATGGVGIHNLGWYAGAKIGKSKSRLTDQIWEFDMWRTRHPKEIRMSNPQFINPRPYVFGKLNDLFLLHVGYGQQRLIFEKSEKSGVEVRYQWSLGPSIAFLKPIYLDILYPISPGDPFTLTTRTERYDPARHFENNIYGSSRFGTGLDEVSVQPGLYAKGGLIFEWGAFTEEVRVLEAGLSVDCFPQRLPVMTATPNPQFFFSFYLGFQLGKRW
ncbi:MAG: hypothetical protein C0424_11860 [Sphingobacteriaceae bacterium]|nr:hypothetical protein [Sphingobacteriaceae bacterium]